MCNEKTNKVKPALFIEVTINYYFDEQHHMINGYRQQISLLLKELKEL